VLEMASGKVPWSEYNFDNIGAAICKIGLDEDIPNIPDTVSEDLRAFILCCLQRDPKKRATAE
jgi:serine/threonine protein kinase